MNLVLCVVFAASAAASHAAAEAPAAGPMTPLEQSALLNEANKAFQAALDTRDQRESEANYRKAIDAYQRLVDSGIRNGKLYYNLANARFRLNDVSRAVVNYKRALRLMPGDEQVRTNLAYARSRVQDKIETSGRKALAESLFFWHFDTSLKSRATAAIALYVIVWGLLIARTLLGVRHLRWPVLAAAVLTVALGASCAVGLSDRGRHREGVIVAEQVTVRKGGGISSEPQFDKPLHAGVEFTLEEVRGDWYRIRLNDGKEGWIPDSSAELI